ncbi:hypothetical protein CC80DRAFT_112742 [Byssothecium circinans]|uniref:Transmembrane protein n=1 Tax=Byssothecium circinans TaxID=147558 RepID=A0A6A5TRT5_9PLEO|nr:hypothetical protein CC80DRAFT_112742 [Byssothecium circinans]
MGNNTCLFTCLPACLLAYLRMCAKNFHIGSAVHAASLSVLIFFFFFLFFLLRKRNGIEGEVVRCCSRLTTRVVGGKVWCGGRKVKMKVRLLGKWVELGIVVVGL